MWDYPSSQFLLFIAYSPPHTSCILHLLQPRVILCESFDRVERRAAGLSLGFSSPPPVCSCLMSSSSMVISTLSFLSFLPSPGSCSWSSSSLPANPYFFSLRDSCFFFSDACAFCLAGSTMTEAWGERGSVGRGG